MPAPDATTGTPPSTFRSKRSSDLVLSWLREQILTGAYPPGSQLPPERMLASDMGVTRNTVRTALGKLEAERLISIRQGRGATVLDYRQEAGISLISHLLATNGTSTRALVRGFLEVRRGIAAEAVAAAVSRVTPTILTELQRLADVQMKETDPDVFIQGDVAFTRLIARAADNLPLELMYNDVLAVLASHPQIEQLRFQNMDAIRPGYQATVDLIRQGDPELARQTMRQMLELVDREALKQF